MNFPSYAPVATTSYTPSSDTTHFHEEVTRLSLFKSQTHKAVLEALAEIYSIVTVLEVVETSFLRDFITDKEKYTATTIRLISQYKTLTKGFVDAKRITLESILPGLEPDLGNLLDLISTKYRLEAPSAIERLKTGIPATIEHLHTHVESSHRPKVPTDVELPTAPTSQSPGPPESKSSARLVAEATGNFITCMDALKLNYNTKEQLHPLLSDLVISLNDLVTVDNATEAPVEFLGKSKLVNWLIKLNNLSPSGELSKEDVDAFLSDLDMAYRGFYEWLE